jgi:hypothetical protein
LTTFEHGATTGDGIGKFTEARIDFRERRTDYDYVKIIMKDSA